MAKVKDIINANTDGVIEATELLRTLKDLEGAIIDGEVIPEQLSFETTYAFVPAEQEFPFDANYFGAEFLNGTLYAFGGEGPSTTNYEVWKFDGSVWTELDTMPSLSSPSPFTEGRTTVYNGLIHTFGSDDTTGGINDHYTFNGSTWTSVDSLPVGFRNGGIAVFNNEIHMLGGKSSPKTHYKWDGATWTKVSTLPVSFTSCSAVVFDNEINILGGTKHYKWDGTSWISVSTVPDDVNIRSVFVLDDAIHIIIDQIHYKWDGTAWTHVDNLPYSFSDGAIVQDNGDVHILTGYNSFILNSSSSSGVTNHLIMKKVYKKIDE